MTMPLRPVRVVGGLRLWLATFCMACVREGSGRWTGRARLPRGRPSATALMASVSDGMARSTSFSGTFVARPESLVERGDFFCRRAIFVGLRDAATGLQPLAERRQLAQSLRRDLQLETARIAQAFL